MKVYISLYKKKIFDFVNKLLQIQKITFSFLVLTIIGVAGFVVYADEGHDAPDVVQVQQSEQVLVRRVGDTDPDNISQEGLGSFYGEITSKDISTINASRDGVISSWNVSVGDRVSTGQVLGYVTVTGVSVEQQLMLAEQQANALKAQLDVETANKVASQTETVFGKISQSLRDIADKQRQQYVGSNSTVTNTYQTELNAITSKQILLTSKLQDFGKTALLQIYPMIANNSTPPNNSANLGVGTLRNGVGAIDSTALNNYITFLGRYITLTNNRQLTEEDIRLFLDRTNSILGVSLSIEEVNKDDIVTKIKELQTDFRDLSDMISQATIDRASKEREKSQIEIELSKSLAGYENDLDLKKLEQTTLTEKAKNEARGAQLLAERLSVSASGVIPILAGRSGIIASVDKNVGDYITISERIGYIAKDNPVKMVRFTIPPSWREIKKGDSLSLIWKTDFNSGSAIITGISPTINEMGGHQAEALLSTNTVFPVGASVRIVPENSKKGVFINSKAVLFDNITPFVWLVTESNTIRKQEITPGRQLGEYVEVLSGLETGFGYLVIFDSSVSLSDGQNVSEIIKSGTPTPVSATTPTVQDESVPHEH
jgi:multidrug efflux pump subunit AcrA (membrane-fusion protein)